MQNRNPVPFKQQLSALPPGPATLLSVSRGLCGITQRSPFCARLIALCTVPPRSAALCACEDVRVSSLPKARCHPAVWTDLAAAMLLLGQVGTTAAFETGCTEVANAPRAPAQGKGPPARLAPGSRAQTSRPSVFLPGAAVQVPHGRVGMGLLDVRGGPVPPTSPERAPACQLWAGVCPRPHYANSLQLRALPHLIKWLPPQISPSPWGLEVSPENAPNPQPLF